jgi:multisubunit Na+/H+ antiporter MnhE subunit
MNQVYENSINYQRLIMVGVANLILFIAFLYFWGLGNRFYPQAILSLAFAVSMTILSLSVEIVMRPVTIELHSRGIVMFFRFSKSRTVAYSQIRRVSDGNRDIQDGSISINGMIQRKLRPDICRAIDAGYLASEGRIPRR